ncbi:MAG: Lipoate-protein ligase A [Chlamydiae bacterium]|nr:Lipoate-protein ligase A [Chlamydiota bacterium]
MNSPINFIKLSNCPIYDQLELEEALLRANDQNWCIVNMGSPDAIVLGISSKPEEMIHLNHLQNNPVPIIKRFSGGGTVYVDQKTLFITFICNKEDTDTDCYPEPILKWGKNFYQNLFDHNDFNLIENDYVMKSKKIGGNALYIRKNRWLLHTSFLWDYDIKKINLLKQPKKIPEYRSNRSHKDFITPLCKYYPSVQPLIDKLPKALSDKFSIEKTYSEIPQEFLSIGHRKSLKKLN